VIPLFKPRVNAGAALDNLAGAFERGYLGEGELVARFEAQLATLLGVSEVLAVDSCTSAITLALHLIGVGPGDEVISTPMTCAATNGAIVRAGARIVWADVDPATGCVNPRSVWEQITRRTKAVVAVDWAGRSCDWSVLRRASWHRSDDGTPNTRERYRPAIPIIQDAAHSLLAGIGGDYVCYSFGPIKHLTCGGHGGALLAPPEQMDRARLLRWHGLDRRSNEDFRSGQRIREAGYKMHLTDVDAAIGLANLPLAALTVEQHRANAAFYDRALANVPGVAPPPPDPGCSYWLYSLLVEDRDGFTRHMAGRGVQTSPVHRRNDVHPAFGGPLPPGALPGVDHFDARHVAIPVGYWVGPSEREQIAAAVIEWGSKQEKEAPDGAYSRVGIPSVVAG
jgi:dTDP-4-amino-4,6-dideoxygalactose transaminase